MHRLLSFTLALFIVGCATSTSTTFDYPETPRVGHTDTYHGKTVSDPYRWLEDDVRNSEQVADWVKAQNNLTQSYLGSIDGRNKITEKMTELWNYERYTTPDVLNGKMFFRKNDGLQNQSVLYVQEGKDAEPRVLIDPNQWAADGTKALAEYVVSPNGNYVAYSIQTGGSDWRKWRVLDVASGEVMTDELNWLKFNTVSWKKDESGFFYSRFPETKQGQEFQSLNQSMAVYYHDLGNAQDADQLIHIDAENPQWGYFTSLSDNGRWLIMTVWHGTDSRYQIIYLDLEDEQAQPKYLVQGFDYEYSHIGGRGDEVFFKTTNGAPLGRVIAVDMNQPSQNQWREVIGEGEFALRDANVTQSFIVAHYIEDAKSALYAFDNEGNKLSLGLPGIGSVSDSSSNSSSDKFYYTFSSLNYPGTQFEFDLEKGVNTVFKAPDVNFSPEDFVVRQVFYTSKDGTKIPMTISHLKGIEPNGALPTLLYGYGGFNISILPRFSTTRLTWMMMGGVFAQANIRGGGEYGEVWHKAGTKLQKQNVFDDFISAAEFLIEAGYTNPDKLAVNGRSNGGLLVGAVVNQRPDLFAAALPAVGVMDMLRFHQFTAGRYWVDDYGSADNAEEFETLYGYSPYHNVSAEKDYPAIMVLTADTDDRVVPGHSFKYIAALQNAYKGPNPVLIRIESDAGHGAGVPTEKLIAEYADSWAFIAHHMDMNILLN